MSADQQDRAVGVLGYLTADTAEQHAFDGSQPAGSHDHQIDALGVRGGQNGFGFRAFQQIFLKGQPVLGQPLTNTVEDSLAGGFAAGHEPFEIVVPQQVGGLRIGVHDQQRGLERGRQTGGVIGRLVTVRLAVYG